MSIRILVLFISIVFAGGCATSTPYTVAPHAHVAQNSTTAPPQQVVPQVVPHTHTEEAPVLRGQAWKGHQKSRDGRMRSLDEGLGSIRGVALTAAYAGCAIGDRDSCRSLQILENRGRGGYYGLWHAMYYGP